MAIRQGTGLPGGTAGGSLTPLADFSGSAGIGERAAAEALQRIGRVANEAFDQFALPNLREEARVQAGMAVAAGEFDRRTAVTPVGADYNQIIDAGHLAKVSGDIERDVGNLAVQHAYDPDGFTAAAADYRSRLVEQMPRQIVGQAAIQLDRHAAQAESVIRRARAQADIQEGEQALTARVSDLNRRLALAEPGSDDWNFIVEERRGLQDLRQSNPAIVYSPEQRERDDVLAVSLARSAYVARVALTEAAGAGGGYQGAAAAYRFLDEQILNGEEFASLPMSERIEMWTSARGAVEAGLRAEIEERRANEAEARERRTRLAEVRGEWQLRVELGEVTADDISNSPELDAGTKAGLLRSLGARNRTERREERESRLEVYRALSDSANAGALSDEEIAENLSAELITAGQAITLRTLRSRTFRPLVSDVMAPVRDALGRPGASLRGRNEILAQAEAAAAEWAQANPTASLADRLAYGQQLSQRFLGGAQQQMTPQQAAQGVAAQLAALDDERRRRESTGNRMTQSEYNRRRQEIMGD